MQIHRTEVGGIPTMWADVPGMLIAHLSFRVGHADETLANRGITHLCEHLALSQFGTQHYSYNGSTGTTITSFSVQGTPEEVTGHLHRLCHGITTGSFTERLEHERRVLDVESGTRPATMFSDHLELRYGPRGHGLLAWGELGLHRIDAAEAQAWAQRYLHRDNAVLWLSGSPPDDLRVDLPDGPRNEADPPEPLLPLLPAWLRANRPPALTALVERSTSAAAAAALAGVRVVEWLRHQRGVAYSPWSEYVRLDADRAMVMLGADGPKANAAEAVSTLLAAVTSLADDGPTEAEVASHQHQARRFEHEPHAPLGVMARYADEMLHGREVTPKEVLDAELDALDAAAVQGAAKAMTRQLLVEVPVGVEVPEWNLVEYARPDVPSTLDVPSVNARYYLQQTRPTDADELAYDRSVVALVQNHRAHGASITSGTHMLVWADGVRRLVDGAGHIAMVRPSAWARGNEIVAWLDSAIPPERQVVMSLRDAGPAGSEAAAFRSVISQGRVVDPNPAQIGPICLDEWTWEVDLPGGVPDSTRRLPGAFLVGWLAHRNQLAAWVEAFLHESLAAFRATRLSPVALFEACGNWCVTDMATPVAAVFLADLAIAETATVHSRYQAGLQQICASERIFDRLNEQHATQMWQMLDAEWTRQPVRGPEWLGAALAPPVPPLSVAPTRCQPIGD